jgi:hypothetical protein
MERAGGEWPADEREQYEGTLAALSGAAATASLNERRAAGRAMTLENAVIYALSERQSAG